MLIQSVEDVPPGILEIIAVIIGNIIEIIKPYISPIGDWMIIWVNFVLQFFPDSNLTIYIIIYVVLVTAALVVNIKWSGKSAEELEKKGLEKEHGKASLDSALKDVSDQKKKQTTEKQLDDEIFHQTLEDTKKKKKK